MGEKFLSREDLLARGIRYSTSQLQRKMRDGSFPSAVRGAGKENRWLESEIDQYVKDLIAARSSRTSQRQGHQAA
jgi:prophage regulatory protein